MTEITIRTVGNRALYESLAKSYDSETHHRTIKSAMRRARSIRHNEKDWVRCSGMWGRVEIVIDGEKLDPFDADWLIGDSSDRDTTDWLLVKHWEDTIKYINGPRWYAFRAYNEQTLYGYGTRLEADSYEDHLNRAREINVYAARPLSLDSVIDLDLNGESDLGFNLGDELIAILEDA